jgi:CHAT domain-containing protein
VFLNACDTGRGFGRADAAFAAGTAPFLIAGGVPAVVANQFPVLDRSAAAFAGHFYERLARGASIGDAMREARVAVRYLVAAEPIDWAVPVLFARNAGDRLV